MQQGKLTSPNGEIKNTLEKVHCYRVIWFLSGNCLVKEILNISSPQILILVVQLAIKSKKKSFKFLVLLLFEVCDSVIILKTKIQTICLFILAKKVISPTPVLQQLVISTLL